MFIFDTIGIFQSIPSNTKEKIINIINKIHYCIKIYVSIFDINV